MNYVLAHNGFLVGIYSSRINAEKDLRKFAKDEDDYWEIFDTLEDNDDEYDEELEDFNLWAVFFS